MSFYEVPETEAVTAGGSNALALLEQADALFDVSYRPAAFHTGDGFYTEPCYGGGKNEGVPLYNFVVREDTSRALGLHSGRYPHIDSYRFLGELAEQTFPESATEVRVWNEGEKVALFQQVAEPIDLGGGDTLHPHVIWISSFNGQWATKVHSLTTRLWCMNQLVGDSLVSVKHTMNHTQTFEFRVGVVAAAKERAEVTRRMALILKDQDFTDTEFDSLVERIVPMPYPEPDTTVPEWKKDRVLAKRGEMFARWNAEVDQWGTQNKWLAFNAVQGAEQHVVNAKGRSEDDRARASLERALNGRTPLADRTLELLHHG